MAPWRTSEKPGFYSCARHAPSLSEDRIYALVGIDAEQHRRVFSKSNFYNHLWRSPHALTSIATIPEETIERISKGLFKMPVNLTINRLVSRLRPRDDMRPGVSARGRRLLGRKQDLFPGIAGQEIIDFFHWLEQ